jgi:hypothetical protein
VAGYSTTPGNAGPARISVQRSSDTLPGSALVTPAYIAGTRYDQLNVTGT